MMLMLESRSSECHVVSVTWQEIVDTASGAQVQYFNVHGGIDVS